jgi:hypothetical protein
VSFRRQEDLIYEHDEDPFEVFGTQQERIEVAKGRRQTAVTVVPMEEGII